MGLYAQSSLTCQNSQTGQKEFLDGLYKLKFVVLLVRFYWNDKSETEPMSPGLQGKWLNQYAGNIFKNFKKNTDQPTFCK